MFFCPLSLQRDLLSVDIDNLMREFQPCIKHDRYKVSHPIADYRRSKFMYSSCLPQVLYVPVAYEIREGRSVHTVLSFFPVFSFFPIHPLPLSPLFSSTLSSLSLLPHTLPSSPLSLACPPFPPTQPQNCGGLLCD